MPKVVDHVAQRKVFTEAAFRLIARDGFEGMTMRAVAKEAALSYGALFHYFDSKEELLVHAIRYSTERQTRRVDAMTARYRGLKALEHLLCDDAVVSDTSRDETRVWLAFAYRAALSRRFGDLHRELIGGWLKRIERLIRDAQSEGEARTDLDPAFEALGALVFSAGISQQALLLPERFTPQIQGTLIRDYLGKLAA